MKGVLEKYLSSIVQQVVFSGIKIKVQLALRRPCVSLAIESTLQVT